MDKKPPDEKTPQSDSDVDERLAEDLQAVARFPDDSLPAEVREPHRVELQTESANRKTVDYLKENKTTIKKQANVQDVSKNVHPGDVSGQGRITHSKANTSQRQTPTMEQKLQTENANRKTVDYLKENKTTIKKQANVQDESNNVHPGDVSGQFQITQSKANTSQRQTPSMEQKLQTENANRKTVDYLKENKTTIKKQANVQDESNNVHPGDVSGQFQITQSKANTSQRQTPSMEQKLQTENANRKTVDYLKENKTTIKKQANVQDESNNVHPGDVSGQFQITQSKANTSQRQTPSMEQKTRNVNSHTEDKSTENKTPIKKQANVECAATSVQCGGVNVVSGQSQPVSPTASGSQRETSVEQEIPQVSFIGNSHSENNVASNAEARFAGVDSVLLEQQHDNDQAGQQGQVHPVPQRLSRPVQEQDETSTDINLQQAAHGTNPPHPLPTDVHIHDDIDQEGFQVMGVDIRARNRHRNLRRTQMAGNLGCASCNQRPIQTVNLPCGCWCYCLECVRIRHICASCQSRIEDFIVLI